MTESNRDVSRRQRIDEFLESYLSSTDRAALYRKYESDLRSIQPLDLFHLRLFSDDSPLRVEEIQKQAGRFVNLFYHGLSAYSWDPHVHPMLEKWMAENRAIMERLERIKPHLESQTIRQSVGLIRDLYYTLAETEKKFAKMQNILFPALEKKLPTAMPFRVLWSVQDELTLLRPRILALLAQDPLPWDEIIPAVGHYHYEMAGLIQKDELILFPVASEWLKPEEWGAMEVPAAAIGFAFLSLDPTVPMASVPVSSGNRIRTATGELSLSQFEWMMGTLPLALTYVDENDKVVYYNETKERHFPRTPQAIGREVRRCHPEKSLATVEKILQEFKAGNRDRAHFWMDYRGRKLLIAYYAVHDSQGIYRGVLEVTQDISEMNAFQGEKRLLDWK